MYNYRSAEALTTRDWSSWLEKAAGWFSKALIGVLTWQAVQFTNTINSSSIQIMKLDAGQEIIRHDMNAIKETINHDLDGIQKDIERIQISIEKINDKIK